MESKIYEALFLFVLLHGFLQLNFVHGQSNDDLHPLSSNPNPIVQLSVYPSSGVSLDNIQVRCQMTLSSSSSPSPSNYDNAYLSVRTDNVRPSGILLMVDHYSNQCRINRAKYLHVDVCNRSLVLVRINHTLLNDSLHTIDYWCNKGDVDAFTSYRITKGHHHAVRYHQAKYHNASASFISSPIVRFLLCTLLLLNRWLISDDIRWFRTI